MPHRIKQPLSQGRLFKENHYGGYIMGIWDKDKSFAPDGQLNEFAPANESGGTKFILREVELINPLFETELGTAPMIHLTVSPLNDPKVEKVVSSIGDTNARKFFDPDDKYKSKVEKGDLPAIVETRVVPAGQQGFNDAFVIRYVDECTDEKIKEYAKQETPPF